MLLEADEEGQARSALPSFYGGRMVSDDWAGPGGRMLGVHSPVKAADGSLVVAAYALARTDGKVAVLLLNRDPGQARAVRLRLGGAAPRGSLALVQYGAGQFRWRPDGARGRPAKSEPPVRTKLEDGGAMIRLPPYSITVAIMPQP